MLVKKKKNDLQWLIQTRFTGSDKNKDLEQLKHGSCSAASSYVFHWLKASVGINIKPTPAKLSNPILTPHNPSLTLSKMSKKKKQTNTGRRKMKDQFLLPKCWMMCLQFYLCWVLPHLDGGGSRRCLVDNKVLQTHKCDETLFMATRFVWAEGSCKYTHLLQALMWALPLYSSLLLSTP